MEFVILLIAVVIAGGILLFSLRGLGRLRRKDPEADRDPAAIAAWEKRLRGQWVVEAAGERVEWLLFLNDGTYVWVYGEERAARKGAFEALSARGEAGRVAFLDGEGGSTVEADIDFLTEDTMRFRTDRASREFSRETGG